MAVVVPKSETPAIEFESDGHANEHHEPLGAPVSLLAMHEESPHRVLKRSSMLQATSSCSISITQVPPERFVTKSQSIKEKKIKSGLFILFLFLSLSVTFIILL